MHSLYRSLIGTVVRLLIDRFRSGAFTSMIIVELGWLGEYVMFAFVAENLHCSRRALGIVGGFCLLHGG